MKNKFLIIFQDRNKRVYYLNNLGGVSEIIDNKILFSTLEKYGMWYKNWQSARSIQTRIWNVKLPKTNSFDIVLTTCVQQDYIIKQKYIEFPNKNFDNFARINIEF